MYGTTSCDVRRRLGLGCRRVAEQVAFGPLAAAAAVQRVVSKEHVHINFLEAVAESLKKEAAGQAPRIPPAAAAAAAKRALRQRLRRLRLLLNRTGRLSAGGRAASYPERRERRRRRRWVRGGEELEDEVERVVGAAQPAGGEEAGAGRPVAAREVAGGDIALRGVRLLRAHAGRRRRRTRPRSIGCACLLLLARLVWLGVKLKPRGACLGLASAAERREIFGA